MDKGLQRKRKKTVSVESDKFIPDEGLITNTRGVGREEEFFRINLGVNPKGRLVDVVDHCKQLPLHLCLPVQWLNEFLSKAD